MATMLGTRELITEDLNVEETDFSHFESQTKTKPFTVHFRSSKSHNTYNFWRDMRSNMCASSFSNLWKWTVLNSACIPNIEAVVGVRGVFSPLEQSPLKLHCDLCDGVGRKLDQHLQQVGPHTVLRGLVVDVAWRREKNMTDHWYPILTFIHT